MVPSVEGSAAAGEHHSCSLMKGADPNFEESGRQALDIFNYCTYSNHLFHTSRINLCFDYAWLKLWD